MNVTRERAAAVLAGNWLGASTVPSRSLYPHQWSWDSAFIAFGLRHLSPSRARRELVTLFEAQWPDGRVPHIVFDPATPPEAYFPGPSFWQAGRTSGLVQPPVHARAVLAVHETAPDLQFLAALYPKLVAWHDHLRTHRDAGGRGLVAIVHPWESGMDNSPAWDGPLSRVTPATGFVRRDLAHGAAGDRPGDDDYGRYVRLAADYRDSGYRDFGTFAVEDPGFNALLADAELALAEIADELGLPSGAHREAAARIEKALQETLWHDGFFFARDVLTGSLTPEYTCAGLLPLVLPDLAVAPALVAAATGPRFRLGRVHGVPSHDLTAPGFDPGRYWRGPSWSNIGWLVRRGLVCHGEFALAARLGGDLVEIAARTDFAEYVDPLTGAGHGTRSFSWTAALTVDLLADQPAAVA
ncbi:hypothetical protein [Amycolatopsis sp. NPDC004625]|uniref:MGH1-like glycoside hydrolase domain-containing protein n=1 Tax=Amycolatopsis sp. NPDC004625 TaxID=3154670 RepID=UPI0033B6A363